MTSSGSTAAKPVPQPSLQVLKDSKFFHSNTDYWIDQMSPKNKMAYEESSFDSAKRCTAIKKMLIEDYVNHWTDAVLFLPNICQTGSWDKTRFKFVDGFIAMVNRPELVKQYLEHIQSNHLNIYGTKGIGKSFVIYMLAAQLMCKDLYRVVYVNLCDGQVAASCVQILLLIYESDQDFFKKTGNLVEYNRILAKAQHELADIELAPIDQQLHTATGYLSKFHKMYTKNEVKLVFIIDQTNNLMHHSFEQQQLFVSTLLLKYGTVIVSGSANNEVSNLKFPPSNMLIPPLRFTDVEAKAFLKLNHELVKDTITNENEFQLLMDLTGGLPIELARFANIKTIENRKNLSAKVGAYQASFNVEYSQSSLQRFLNQESSKGRLISIAKTINHLILRFPLDSSVAFYDKRIISEQIVDDNRSVLVPINTLAKNMILATYEIHSDQLSQDFNQCYHFQMIVSPSTQGNLINDFIVESLAKQEQFDLEIRHLNEGTKTKISFSNYHTVRLPHRYAPVDSFAEHSTVRPNVLFAPLVANYPIFDFFVYMAPGSFSPLQVASEASSQETGHGNFFCFQITNSKEVDGHERRNDQKFLSTSKAWGSGDYLLSEWTKYLPKGTVFYEIWLINETHRPSSKAMDSHLANLNFAYFQDMDLFRSIKL